MKQIEKILNYFGLCLKSKLDKTQTNLISVELELNELRKKYNTYFDKPDTNNRYIKENENWNQYWERELAHKYMAHQFKEIVKHPEILRNLIYSLTMYNWKETQEYMKSVNWYWSDSKQAPTIKEMQGTCIELLYTNLVHNYTEDKENTASSGGFYVTIRKNKEVEIKFEKSDKTY